MSLEIMQLRLEILELKKQLEVKARNPVESERVMNKLKQESRKWKRKYLETLDAAIRSTWETDGARQEIDKMRSHELRQERRIASLEERLNIAENDRSMTQGCLEEMKNRHKAQVKMNEVMVAYIFPGQPPLPVPAPPPYAE